MSYDFTRTGPEIQAIHDKVSNLNNVVTGFSGCIFESVGDMLMNTNSISPTESVRCRTYEYNTRVICDWRWTQNPGPNDYSIELTSNPGWYAVLYPLLGNILTPEMVGAYSNMTNEDHESIQECLDYFENNSLYGVVALNGNYLIGDTVFGRSHASIIGTGHMRAKDALNKPVLDIYAQYPVRKIENTKYSGFTINGNKDNQATTDPYMGAGMIVRADVENPFTNGDPQDRGETENIVVKDITCDDCKISGFVFGKNTFVTRSYSYSNLKANGAIYGVYIDNFCEYITFTDMDLQQNQYGVYDNGSSNISFIGGTYANNTEAGIYIPTTGRNTSKKIINGIKINHNKRGVWIGVGVGAVGSPVDHIVITNNHILANDRQGIVGTGGVDVICKENVFSGNGFETANTYDDIFISISCSRWDVDNKHINSTGDTRHAVFYENGSAAGIDNHKYHKIDGTFEDYDTPISYSQAGNPVTQPINANTNIVQGVFEYWNSPGTPPSENASNTNASVDLTKIPLGTICINNGDNTGGESWIAVRSPSSAGLPTSISFRRIADYV